MEVLNQTCPKFNVSLTDFDVIFNETITILNGLIGFWIALGNSFVLLVFLTSKHKYQPGDLHIMSLAISDILQGLITIPTDEILMYLNVYTSECFYVYTIGTAVTFVQVPVLLMAAFDRYWAVVEPFEYRATMTMKKTSWIIFGTWFLIPIFGGIVAPFRTHYSSPCKDFIPCINADLIFNETLTTIVGLGFLLPPLLIAPYLYYKVYKVMSKLIQRRQKQTLSLWEKLRAMFRSMELADDYSVDDARNSNCVERVKDQAVMKEMKMMVYLSVTVFLYVLCQLPILLIALMQIFGTVTLTQFHFLTFLNHINSAVDPFIYGLRTEERKEEAILLWNKIKFWNC